MKSIKTLKKLKKISSCNCDTCYMECIKNPIFPLINENDIVMFSEYFLGKVKEYFDSWDVFKFKIEVFIDLEDYYDIRENFIKFGSQCVTISNRRYILTDIWRESV